MSYYDGTKLLSLSDINGDKPEVYICDGNRTGGKTTYFNKLMINRFLKNKSKFACIYRFNYELDNIAEKFFKDIKGLFFPQYDMISERKSNGIFHELFLTKGKEKISCGYGITLNSADQIKKMSHFFSDVDSMIFDEFQSETNHYCSNEVEKLLSIHTSIARGQGKQVRYVPIYMLSNHVSIINPYYIALDISQRIREDTKFLKGNGYVVEFNYNDNASKAQSESPFNKAFASNKYVAYSSQNVYLNDNTAFIEKPVGKNKYICTLKYQGREYGVRQYPELGLLYCDDKPDISNPNKLSVTTDDHNINYVMLHMNRLFIDQLRFYFDKGCFRFKDLNSKEALIKCFS